MPLGFRCAHKAPYFPVSKTSIFSRPLGRALELGDVPAPALKSEHLGAAGSPHDVAPCLTRVDTQRIVSQNILSEDLMLEGAAIENFLRSLGGNMVERILTGLSGLRPVRNSYSNYGYNVSDK